MQHIHTNSTDLFCYGDWCLNHQLLWSFSHSPSRDFDAVNLLCLFVSFEFRSSRSVRTIAGPGGVIGPLSRPKERWENHR